MANPIASAMSAVNDFGRDRILTEYGGRPDMLVNASGVGTKIVIQPTYMSGGSSGRDENIVELFKTFDDETKSLVVTALAPISQPLRTHDANIGGLIRGLSGNAFGYRKNPVFGIDITVIGNSPDYYRLMMLEHYYVNFRRTGNTTVGTPLLNMIISPASAPGLNLMFDYGIMTSGNPGVTIDSGPKIADKTFSFEFGKFSPPSESAQKYGMGFLSSMIGFDVGI